MNLDDRVRRLIGDLLINNMALQLENEQLKVQIAALSKPEPDPPQESKEV